jgi:hypothetical protein
MANEVERVDRALEFADKAYNIFKDIQAKYPAINERKNFLNAVGQAFMDSECADCGYSPVGRVMDETTKAAKGDYSI